MQDLSPNIQQDIADIGRIDAVPSILEVICRTTGMGFAAVARVTDDRWIACAVRDEINFGLVAGGELKLETTICNEIRQNHQPVVIDHVAEDIDFCNHHTPAMYGFQSYISVPITLKDGSFFGTLCAIDPNPAQLNNPQIRGMFALFADMLAMHLHNFEQLNQSKALLKEERKIAELRDQFIAILGHDLRNPIGAVKNVAQLMLRRPADEQVQRWAKILTNSSFRMIGLIENVLDFARGKMGGGIVLDKRADENLAELLAHVVTELQLVWPERLIEMVVNLDEPVYADGRRLAQLLSNLLSNALTYGEKDKPVKIEISSLGSQFKMSVANFGVPIEKHAMTKLFQPFAKGKSGEGLGLGLYISSEIAKAPPRLLYSMDDISKAGTDRKASRQHHAKGDAAGGRRNGQLAGGVRRLLECFQRAEIGRGLILALAHTGLSPGGYSVGGTLPDSG